MRFLDIRAFVNRSSTDNGGAFLGSVLFEQIGFLGNMHKLCGEQNLSYLVNAVVGSQTYAKPYWRNNQRPITRALLEHKEFDSRSRYCVQGAVPLSRLTNGHTRLVAV